MESIKKFFSLKYYFSILSGQTKFRFLLAAFILALIIAISPSFFIITKFYPLVQNLESKVTNLVDEIYPAELEIKIKNGLATTNVTEPYYVNIKKETLENIFSALDNKSKTFSKLRILTVDTKGKAEDFERYQSLALLTQNSLIYYNENKINIYPLRDIQDLSISQGSIKSSIKEINKNNSISNLITFGIFVAPFFMVFGLWIFFISAFFITSIAVYIIVKINQMKIEYKKILGFSAAVSCLPTLIQNLLYIVPLYSQNFGGFDKLFDMFILGLAYWILRKYKQKS